eukprot:GILI01004890.1.p1 GENE.GILI01004890.1~~GILI01004890.1.p1  ORF type:complete len:418 (+),score=128.64 GILI01004890.1:98-1255(+)
MGKLKGLVNAVKTLPSAPTKAVKMLASGALSGALRLVSSSTSTTLSVLQAVTTSASSSSSTASTASASSAPAPAASSSNPTPSPALSSESVSLPPPAPVSSPHLPLASSSPSVSLPSPVSHTAAPSTPAGVHSVEGRLTVGAGKTEEVTLSVPHSCALVALEVNVESKDIEVSLLRCSPSSSSTPLSSSSSTSLSSSSASLPLELVAPLRCPFLSCHVIVSHHQSVPLFLHLHKAPPAPSLSQLQSILDSHFLSNPLPLDLPPSVSPSVSMSAPGFVSSSCGSLVVRFSNRYSRLTSKTVNYCVHTLTYTAPSDGEGDTSSSASVSASSSSSFSSSSISSSSSVPSFSNSALSSSISAPPTQLSSVVPAKDILSLLSQRRVHGSI